MSNRFDELTERVAQWATRHPAVTRSGARIPHMALAIAFMVLLAACSVPAANFVGFNAGPFYSILGALNSPTEGAVLQVAFNEPVAFDTFVSITSSDPTVLTAGFGGVTVPTGRSSA